MARHSRTEPVIAYREALDLPIANNGTTVAQASNYQFKGWLFAQLAKLPVEKQRAIQVDSLDFSYLPDRWAAVCQLRENGMPVPEKGIT